MKIAVISDIHANLFAFEKIVQSITLQKVDGVIFLGDLTFMGLYPQECFDLLKSLQPLVCLRGNTDENLMEKPKENNLGIHSDPLLGAVFYAWDNLHTKARTELLSWPIMDKVELDGVRILCCHGTPYNVREIFNAASLGFSDCIPLQGGRAEESLTALSPFSLKYKQVPSDLYSKISEEPESIILCGHTHLPHYISWSNKTSINFGAVGYNFNEEHTAKYGIISIDKYKAIQFSQINVEYNNRKYCDEINSSSVPFAKSLISLVSTGKPL